MDQRPIGVFDSGIGGLTMVRELSRLMPFEDIIYLGDTGRVPYGTRSQETIIEYAYQDAEFLTSLDIKAMIIACNTVCSIAYDSLRYAYDIPVFEVIQTPSEIAARATKNGKIGIIGTKATIRSAAYERTLFELTPGLNLYSVSCPLFVPLAEEGLAVDGNEISLLAAHMYLDPLRENEIDTLILGCTHYSLFTGIIKQVMGSDVTLIDSGAVTAEYIATELKEQGLLSDDETEGKQKYYVTDSPEDFSANASRFLKSDVRGMVKQIALF